MGIPSQAAAAALLGVVIAQPLFTNWPFRFTEPASEPTVTQDRPPEAREAQHPTRVRTQQLRAPGKQASDS